MLEIKTNVALAPHTTFKVGGTAKQFVEVKTVSELKEALELAEQNNWPIFVLAGGSNVIFATKEFEQLFILIKIDSLKTSERRLTAGASTMMSEIVSATTSQGLKGMEWAGGLPGTFGGAIRGNAGAFGGEMKDSVVSVQAINTKSRELKTYLNRECQFAYRESYFKHHPEEIIVSAELELNTGDQQELEKIAQDHINFRKTNHPQLPTAGSIFKNTPVEKVPSTYLEQVRSVVKSDPFPVVPTGKIIADAGLVGASIGGAQVSSQHANIIVNNGSARGEDIYQLIEKIKATVREKFQVELEVEPELVGF